jgi:hypothetical protein
MDKKELEARRKLREWSEGGKRPEPTKEQAFGEFDLGEVFTDPRTLKGAAPLLEVIEEKSGLPREASATLALYVLTRFGKPCPGKEAEWQRELDWLRREAGPYSTVDIESN